MRRRGRHWSMAALLGADVTKADPKRPCAGKSARPDYPMSRNSVPARTASSWQARIRSVGPAFRPRGALIDPTSSGPESLWGVSGQTGHLLSLGGVRFQGRTG